MPGRFSLYMDLSVEENLSFYAMIFGTTIKENYDLIKDIYCQIEPFETRRPGSCRAEWSRNWRYAVPWSINLPLFFWMNPPQGRCCIADGILGNVAQAEGKQHHHHGVHTIHGWSKSVRPRGAYPGRKIMKISRPEEIVADYRYRLWPYGQAGFWILSDLHAYPEYIVCMHSDKLHMWLSINPEYRWMISASILSIPDMRCRYRRDQRP